MEAPPGSGERDDVELIIPLWEEAKRLEKKLPALRKAALERIKTQFKGIRYRSFGALRTAERASKGETPYSSILREECAVLDRMSARARWCRQESDRLIKIKQGQEFRPLLDPRNDPIPAGDYPKLRNCTQYPLRQSCDHGENEVARWVRCKFMTYDRTQPVDSHRRWTCTAPEE